MTSEHYWCECRAEKLTILQCLACPEQERLVLPKTSKYPPLRNPAKLHFIEENDTRPSFPPPACFPNLISISFSSLFYTPPCSLQLLFSSAPSFNHIVLLAILIEYQEVLCISASGDFNYFLCLEHSFHKVTVLFEDSAWSSPLWSFSCIIDSSPFFALTVIYMHLYYNIFFKKAYSIYFVFILPLQVQIPWKQ